MSGRRTLYAYVRALESFGKPIPRELRQFRPRDAEREAEDRMRAWFADQLATTDPRPGQAHDTRLGAFVGWKTLAKGHHHVPSQALAITDYETLSHGGWLVTAEGQVDGALAAGFLKLATRVLSEMHNKGLGVAGEIRSVRVENGAVRLIARIAAGAEAIAQKIRHRVLPFVEVIHDGEGRVLDVSLVDRPAPDGLEKAGRTVIAKLFRERDDDVKTKKLLKKLAKAALPAETEAKLQAYEAARVAVAAAGDQMAAKAAVARAADSLTVEFIKAARQRPASYGDTAMIAFLRGGRP